MGIHGLTSFIDNNPHLLKDHQLHDCRVVIDGNNFYHFLYFYCNVRFQFGGDYDIFHRKICMIFSMFKECNVEVFVVFDGAYTVDGKKFRTTLGRARDRVYAAERVMNGQRGVLIPCLARHTFVQTLDKLGVPHVTCDFEADNQLVSLANQWNCPVISNDSDFYIFDLSGGFIPLDYIDFRPRTMPQGSSQEKTAGSCLPVQFYHVDKFISCFKSLKRSVLPLFATMLGNDYVNAAAFEAFYQKTPKIASRRYASSKKHQKIVSVLYWLEDKHQEGELVSEVLSFIRPDRREQVQKLLNSSISGYLDTKDFESFNLRVFMEGDREAARQKTDAVTTVTGERLPAWFVTACRCGEVPVFLMNAVLHHIVMLPTQVESKCFTAASTASRWIRQITYGVLLGAQDADTPPDPLSHHPPQQAAQEMTPAGYTTSYSTKETVSRICVSEKVLEDKTVKLESSDSANDAKSLVHKIFKLEKQKPSAEILEKSFACTAENTTEDENFQLNRSADILQTSSLTVDVKPHTQTSRNEKSVEGSKPSPNSLEKSDLTGDSTSLVQPTENISDDKNFQNGVSKPIRNTPEKLDLESNVTCSSKKQAKSGILEYTRHNMELRRIMVLPCSSLSAFGCLPSLETLPSIGHGDRTAILTATLGVTPSFLSKFDPSLQLYMMCLVFWAKNAEPSVSRHLLKGIMLSAVLLHVHREIASRNGEIVDKCISENGRQLPDSVHSKGAQRNGTGASPTISIAHICSESDHVLIKVRDNLKKYYHEPAKVCKKNPPVTAIFHNIAQFLACLLDADHLNSLMLFPLPTPDPASLFNGSFIYTIVRELEERSNPDLFLSEMLVKGSSLMLFFDSLCSAVVEEVGGEVFTKSQSQGKKRCKGTRKRKQQAGICWEQIAAGEVSPVKDRPDEEGTIFYDLNNRFGALMMDLDV